MTLNLPYPQCAKPPHADRENAMSPNRIIRTMNEMNWQIVTPNGRRDEVSEIEARGLMEFRQGAWRTTAEGRRFLKEHGEEA